MPLSGYIISGGRRAEFFTVTVGTTQTTFTSSTPVYQCTSQITSDGANDDNGIRTWTLDQVQADTAYWSFVQTYAPASTSSATTEELTMEDAEIISGAAAGSTTLAMMVKGAKIKAEGGADNNKTLAWGGLVKVAKTSGSVNFAGTAYVKPTLSAIATSITTDLVIPSAVVSNYCTTATTSNVTIAASQYPYGKMLVEGA